VKLLVVGASGRTGRLVVEQALGHGHEVTAFVRDPARLAISRERLSVVVGDATAPVTFAPALEGQDAVISVLGAGRGSAPTVLADGAANLARAMTARGVARLVIVSAAGVGGHAGELPLIARAFSLLPAMRAVREAQEAMEGEVMLSSLDWTIVRAATLTNKERTGHYRVVEGPIVPGGKRIARGDLAAFVLKVAETGRYPRKIVSVAY
jgi:putative NADH-flavin reductase